MKEIINKYLKKARNNGKVIENYIFMTSLQVINSFFYLLIYPYLIKVLGVYGYGVYIFANTITTYFTFFINFGLELPSMKFVVLNTHNKEKLANILSQVFTTRCYLFILSTIVFSILLFTIPFFANNKLVFLTVFLTSFVTVLFPQWYFQGKQQMRVVTLIQFSSKLLSLPFIFIFVKSNEDLLIYCIIVAFFAFSGGVFSFVKIYFIDEIKIRFSSFISVKSQIITGLPFFYSTLAGVLKENSIPLIIGSFFTMRDVAVFDLASKVIIIPRTIFMSINAAIFPKILENINDKLIKKIIKVEFIISTGVIAFIVLMGKFIIEVLAGNNMLDSYILSVFLSFTILSWLVVGAYINFIFIPKNKNYFIARNQIVALLSFFIFCFIGILIKKSILIFGISLALSGLTEIFYCKYLVKKYKMLE